MAAQPGENEAAADQSPVAEVAQGSEDQDATEVVLGSGTGAGDVSHACGVKEVHEAAAAGTAHVGACEEGACGGCGSGVNDADAQGLKAPHGAVLVSADASEGRGAACNAPEAVQGGQKADVSGSKMCVLM